MYHEPSYQKVKRGIFEKSARPQKYVFMQYDKETADENMKKSARIEQSEKGGLIKHVVETVLAEEKAAASEAEAADENGEDTEET